MYESLTLTYLIKLLVHPGKVMSILDIICPPLRTRQKPAVQETNEESSLHQIRLARRCYSKCLPDGILLHKTKISQYRGSRSIYI